MPLTSGAISKVVLYECLHSTQESPGITACSLYPLPEQNREFWFSKAQLQALWPPAYMFCVHAFQQRAVWLQCAVGDPSLALLLDEFGRGQQGGTHSKTGLQAASHAHTWVDRCVHCPQTAFLGWEHLGPLHNRGLLCDLQVSR